MNPHESAGMTLSTCVIILIILNIGFPLQNVLGKSLEDSIDRIIESANDDSNRNDNDNDSGSEDSEN